MKLRIWHLSASAVGGIVVTLACQWIIAAAGPGHDSVDRFAVKSVVKEPGGSAYAVLVNYEHGNSSTGVDAIWLGDGDAPTVGSMTPLEGAPVLVSVAPMSGDQLTFGADHRLAVDIRGPLEVSNDPNHCYFDDVPDRAVCLNGRGIRLNIE
jgi:hypothetical protein